jgi:hypothetical protein
LLFHAAAGSPINLRRPVQGFFDDLFSNPAYHAFDLTRRDADIGASGAVRVIW